MVKNMSKEDSTQDKLNKIMLEYYKLLLEDKILEREGLKAEQEEIVKLAKERNKMFVKFHKLNDKKIIKGVSKIIEENWEFIDSYRDHPFFIEFVKDYFLENGIDLDLIFTDKYSFGDSDYFKVYGLKEQIRFKKIISKIKEKMEELMKKDRELEMEKERRDQMKILEEKLDLFFNKAVEEGLQDVSRSHIKRMSVEMGEDIAGNLDMITNAVSVKLGEKFGNTPTRKRKPITKSLRHEVFKRDGYKCVECGATKKETKLHVDHIIPVSQGGSDELDNFQTLCEACNLAKKNRKWKGGKK